MSVTQEDFDNTVGTYEVGRNMLYERINDAWRDMQGSTRRLMREEPSEARLLFYVLMSDMIFFVSWSLKTIVAPATAQVPIGVAFILVGALLLRTGVMYLFSIVLGSALRVLGGNGSWRDTRLAVFWGALVAAPFGFLLALVTVVFRLLEPVVPALGADAIRLLPYWISVMPFVWFISAGLAEVHGFKNTTTVFACMLGVVMVIMLAAMVVLSNLI